MDAWLVLLVLAVLFGGIAVGMPIFLSLTLAGSVGLVLLVDFDFAWNTLATVPYLATNKSSLILVPMYVVMGVFMLRARLSEDLFDMAGLLMARLRTGVGIATIAACAGFAAVTGSSAATVAAVGRVAVPQMIARGFTPRFAAAIVATGGTLGVMIPPSVVLVVYGVLAQVSIGQLMVAGIVPGLLSAVVYGVYIGFFGKRYLSALTVDVVSGSTNLSAVRRDVLRRGTTASLQTAVVLGTVVLGVYGGFMTVTESGMVAALVVACFLVWRLRKEGLRRISEAFTGSLSEGASLTAMVFLLFVGGTIFSAYLVAARVPQDVTTSIVGLDVSAGIVVVLILAILIPMGMFLDSMSILLVVVPVAAPLVSAMEVNMVWFGILLVKMIELGLITPPLGLNAFVIAGVLDDIPVEQVFRGLIPFFFLELVTVGILFACPDLVTWLPSLVES